MGSPGLARRTGLVSASRIKAARVRNKRRPRTKLPSGVCLS